MTPSHARLHDLIDKIERKACAIGPPAGHLEAHGDDEQTIPRIRPFALGATHQVDRTEFAIGAANRPQNANRAEKFALARFLQISGEVVRHVRTAGAPP